MIQTICGHKKIWSILVEEKKARVSLKNTNLLSATSNNFTNLLVYCMETEEIKKK